MAFERFERAAGGLAGAGAEPFHVWLGDWRAEAAGPPGGDGVPHMTLSAAEGGIGIELRLENQKPPVLQGDGGLSQKGSSPGNASYYYSLTRMSAAGIVRLPGGEFEVTGTAWMDREWSTSALEADQEGWDWFALQLDDGADVMYYQMRLRGGMPDSTSRGVIVDPGGKHDDISFSGAQLDVLDRWESPDGGVYPSTWRLRSEPHGIDLTITPLIRDQELDVSFRYWEGAVDVTGTRDGEPVGGVGFVELTGYAE
jgi:predicted secreted hydrolase